MAERWAVEFEDAELRRDLERVILLLNDLRPFWALVVPVFNSWMKRQFEGEGAFFGDPWEPLTPEYAAWKSIHYPGKSILSAEGDLRRAATSAKRRTTPHTLILEIEPYTKEGETLEPSWFEDGTARMSRRPLLGFDVLPGEARGELDALAASYVGEMIRRLGMQRV
jgi:hypothetical protein